MPRVITITIPDDQDVSEVDHVIDEFQSELGHVCGDDEWTDRSHSTKRSVTVMIKDDFDPTLGSDIVEAIEDFEQLLAVEFEEV